ncbi:MAG: adenylate/guanylate cyclase domain-containing protein [Ignavibacteria bacterium]|jgi:class 3 adenylate cyclase/ActR/RegA family two-component response regulator
MEKKDFNILYVDDEEHNLHSFKAVFRREYKIFTALSGEEGIRILKNNNVNLIITDQRMPGMTGIQFLEKIVPQYPEIIRMVLTGFSDIDAIIDAINTGRVFRYINKPWNENELRMTIENARKVYELQKNNSQLMYDLKQKVEDQEKTLKLFMKYVPEQVVEKTLTSTEETMFDGEERYVTVLFCDIRGFTSFSEKLSPKEIVAFLNDYYSTMEEPIRKYQGSINQFVGDEIFAVFGAPQAIEENEKNAVYSAIEMMERLKTLNNRYGEKFGGELKVGIGINSGEVVAGNLGTQEKIEYSLTGDTVNTGKRIEMLTKEDPSKILVSESTYKKISDCFTTKAWDKVAVKGKSEKITVYEIEDRIYTDID